MPSRWLWSDRRAHGRRCRPLRWVCLGCGRHSGNGRCCRFVRDVGFDPVLIGPLSRAREFDVGTSVYNTNMSGPEVQRALGLAEMGMAKR
jgi:predicted dinucleotide-binding enzyme